MEKRKVSPLPGLEVWNGDLPSVGMERSEWRMKGRNTRRRNK
jgi:hypothetical protein